MLNQKKNIYAAGWILLLVGIILLAIKRIFPADFALPPCVFHKWTGYYCPGCGGTRAVKALLRGDVIGSFFYHLWCFTELFYMDGTCFRTPLSICQKAGFVSVCPIQKSIYMGCFYYSYTMDFEEWCENNMGN